MISSPDFKLTSYSWGASLPRLEAWKTHIPPVPVARPDNLRKTSVRANREAGGRAYPCAAPAKGMNVMEDAAAIASELTRLFAKPKLGRKRRSMGRTREETMSDDASKLTPAGLEAAIRQALKEHWKVFLLQGVVLVVLGILAAIAPNIASFAVELLVGWLLLLAGLARIFMFGTDTSAPGYWSSMLLGLLMAVLGLSLLLSPAQGLLTLTLVLTIYLIAHGIGSLILAFKLRPALSAWLWILAGAVVDFVLAALILSGWPGTATWIIGLMVGINLLFSGLALIFAALGARDDSSAAH